MSQENQNFEWIRINASCKWNDPAMCDYDVEEFEYAQNRIWTICEITYEEDGSITADSMISITNEDGGFAEVNASELIQINELQIMFDKVRELSDELDDTFRAIYNYIAFKKLNGDKTYYDGGELTTESVNELWTKVIEVKDFCYC